MTDAAKTSRLSRDDVAEIGTRFQGAIVQPGDAAYEEARRVWNGMIDKHPSLIARCRSDADVISAVEFARRHHVAVAVRGGGHSVAGYGTCDNGMVIDLSCMNAVEVDTDGRVVHVQAGATLGDVDRETQRFGLVTPTGNASTTGIAGLTLGGGMGHLRRKLGLAVDNLQQVRLVTADGRHLTASATENAELFWGIRGGGGNFGVVTSFRFELSPLGPTVMFMVVLYPFEMVHEVLRAWRSFTDAAPREVTSDALIWRIPPAPAFPEAIHGKSVIGLAGMYAGDGQHGERVFAPLREIGRPVLDMSGVVPYVAAQSSLDAVFPAVALRYYWKSLYLDALSDDVIDTIVAEAVNRPSPFTFIPIRHMGGAIADVADDATAVANRNAPYLLSIDDAWSDPADDEKNVTWTRDLWRTMHRFSKGGVYLNFAGLGEEGAGLSKAGHGDNYDRLVALKDAFDPTNLFRLNQNIEPSTPTGRRT